MGDFVQPDQTQLGTKPFLLFNLVERQAYDFAARQTFTRPLLKLSEHGLWIEADELFASDPVGACRTLDHDRQEWVKFALHCGQELRGE